MRGTAYAGWLAAIKPKEIRMNEEQLNELTDEELLNEAKKMKSNSIINALLIGFCIGIITWSVANSTWGFLTLIPLFIIYRIMNNSKDDKKLKQVLKERNLK